MKKQRGVGLVELMVSLLLASLLVTLGIQQYLVGKRQYLSLHTLLEQDLELQLINDLLRDSVRRAGFTPCLGIDSLQSMDHRQQNSKLTAIATKVDNREVLQLRRMSEHFTTVLKLLSHNQLLLQSNLSFESKQVILIADCYHAEVQQISQVNNTNLGTLLTLTHPLAFRYLDPIYLGEWVEEDFYIQKNQQGSPALFYRRKHAEELSNLISTMTTKHKTYHGKSFLDVIWGLDQGKTVRIETGIRSG